MKIVKKVQIEASETNNKKSLALEKARQVRMQNRKNAIENGEESELTKRNPDERWQDNKKSMRHSINRNCYICCGGENFRARIKYCNIFKCSFWLLRPYSRGYCQLTPASTPAR